MKRGRFPLVMALIDAGFDLVYLGHGWLDYTSPCPPPRGWYGRKPGDLASGRPVTSAAGSGEPAQPGP